MKLIIVANDGEVLDSTTVSAYDWKQELQCHPHGLAAQLQVSHLALELDDTPDQEA